MKYTPIVLVIAFLVALYGSGCTLSDEQKENLSKTGSYVAQRVAGIALQTVINGAIAASDRERNIDFTQGLAEGLRTQQGNLLTGNDVKAIVDIWTPEKPGFEKLGTQMATIYEQMQPKTRGEAATVLEGMARGLDKATANQ